MRLFLCAVLCASGAMAQTTIPLKTLHDKIAGGWAGQMIGVSFGAPTEFKALGRILKGELPKWTPDRVENSLHQDDLYVDMTFAEVLDAKGLHATPADFGEMFKNSKYQLWHANLAGRRNLKRGIPAGDSGSPRYNAHANDIDFQIESDFVGLMTPGLYRSATQIAMRAGRVMNYGDGIYGGIFVSCMYAAAFLETDPRRVVERGLACIPANSPFALVISDVLTWSRQSPDDWKKVWRLIEDKWDRNDPCPEGALLPFNIDAKLNGAYIALGLLYGARDFGKTLEIATRSGQDSDCNPASAGGILGVMLGYDAIPEDFKGGIAAIADRKFDFTDFSFRTIVASTEKRTLELARETGGRVDKDEVRIKNQTPAPPKLETWNYGTVAERLVSTDPRWTFTGAWTTDAKRPLLHTASAKGAAAEVRFSGTGAIVLGDYLPTGGMLDAFLDGKLDRTLDANSDEPSHSRTGESVYHVFGLKPGPHTIRLVVRGEPYAGSTGTDVAVGGLIRFQ
jgi:hypothetical protein